MKLIKIVFGILVLCLSSCDTIKNEIDANEKNEIGLQLLNEGQFQPAIKSFQEALKNKELTPGTKSQILRNIGQTYFELSLSDSASHYYIKAANCFKPNSYEYLVNMADVNINKGKTEIALEQLLKAYKLNPNDLAVNNTLGLIYLGDYGDKYSNPASAVKYNLKAHEINNDRITEDVLARNYMDLKQYEKALSHYKNLFSNYPQFPDYLVLYGNCQLKLGKLEEAEKYFNAALEADSAYLPIIESFKIE